MKLSCYFYGCSLTQISPGAILYLGYQMMVNMVAISLCPPPSNIRMATCPGDEAVAWSNICNILRNIKHTFLYSFCFTCYGHKTWTHTSIQCLPIVIQNLFILEIVFDCCCFIVVRSYQHLIRCKVQIFDTRGVAKI